MSEPCVPALTDAVADVVASWETSDDRTRQTTLRMGEIARRFARRATVSGYDTITAVTPELCEEFIHAPSRTGERPSVGTMHFRRVTIRAIYRTLRGDHPDLGDPTLDIDLPSRGDRPPRPLTTDEIILCRTGCFPHYATDSRRAAAWALAEATVVTSEIPLIRPSALDHPPTRVSLPGGRRTDPRTVPLTGWGATVLARRISELDGDHLLAYDGNSTIPEGRQAAICRHIERTFQVVGLDTDRSVRPSSIRLWRARLELERGMPIEGVARLLGGRSLDRTAIQVGYDWKASR